MFAIPLGADHAGGCFRAEECGSEFRDKLFHGIGVIAETLAELPVAAALMAREMTKFM